MHAQYELHDRRHALLFTVEQGCRRHLLGNAQSLDRLTNNTIVRVP